MKYPRITRFSISFMLVIPFIMLNSCDIESREKYPQYEYGTMFHVPDSNQVKYSQFVIAVMSSSTSHLTTSDYEDPEDVLEQAEETGKEIFSVKEEGLHIKATVNGYWDFKFKRDLTKSELIILDNLKNR